MILVNVQNANATRPPKMIPNLTLEVIHLTWKKESAISLIPSQGSDRQSKKYN